MKRIALIACLSIGLVSAAQAQTAEDAVKATVNKMFGAMKHADAGTLFDCFADSALLQTIAVGKDGKVTVKSETVDDFGKMVASMPKDMADERIVFETIRIDGNMANVWTPYNFYYKGKFSHCGVNNFVLVKMDNEWKIQYLIDTRRKSGCKE